MAENRSTLDDVSPVHSYTHARCFVAIPSIGHKIEIQLKVLDLETAYSSGKWPPTISLFK